MKRESKAAAKQSRNADCDACNEEVSKHHKRPVVLHYASDHGDGEHAFLVKGTTESAGADVSSAEDGWAFPFLTKSFETNIRVAVPFGHVGLVKSRSSSFLRSLYVEGVIDSDYNDHTIRVMVHNLGLLPRRIKRGERIAQLVVVPAVIGLHHIELDGMPSTGRGGFGSTGK